MGGPASWTGPGQGFSSFSGSLERSWLVLSRDLLDEHKLRLENELFSVMQVSMVEYILL